MKLEIKNFGKIKQANIDIEGLTVITGCNDSGKSTVGKIVFWLFNELSNYNSHYYEDLFFKYHVNQIYDILKYLVRKNYAMPVHLKEIVTKNEMLIDLFVEKISFRANIRNRKFNLSNIAKELLDVIKKNKLENDPALSEQYKEIKNFIEADFVQKMQHTLLLSAKDIFNGNINNSIHNNINAQVKLFQEDKIIYSLEIAKNITSISSNKNLTDEKLLKSLWSNVDFIETPLILDDVRQNKMKPWEKKFLQRLYEYNSNTNEDFSIIKELLEADITIDKISKKITYKKNKNAQELDMLNVASGAKSFIVLDILNKFGNFGTDSITIFDEPENHLHPEWQLKYAQQLIKFIKKGANIILTSHSPYMIKALKFYSVEYGLKKEQYRFLLSENLENNWAQINDVTDETYKIFNLLGKPLYDIEYV